MIRGLLVRLLLLALCVVGTADTATAQVVPLAERGPRFLRAVPSGGRIVVDATSSPTLRRVVSLALDSATVGGVLASIEKQTGLEFLYSRAILPVDRPVTLRAERISVAAALMEILVDAKVDVLLTSTRQILLVRRGTGPAGGAAGSVSGKVTDAKTGQAIAGVDIVLEGTRWRTATGDNGTYRLLDVAPGTYTMAARRIGYTRVAKSIVIADGQELVTDLTLAAAPTQLNELVTTVTGEQRRLELGHVVGVIRADSVVKQGPVSTLSELLNGRVPGLQVFQGQGTVGGTITLQVRGPNSLLLGLEPIVIVDGVRYTNSRAGRPITSYNGPDNVEQSSPLNDLNPNDIETIEVVKGPSAATLYGTDAANGVIVITTKRGARGPARWNAYGRATRNQIDTPKYPDVYHGWSQQTDPYNCDLYSNVNGYCTLDSVTKVGNPLNNSNLTLFGAKPIWQTGLNVGGGRQDLQYYFSGDYSDATGPIQMPKVLAERLEQRRGSIPEEWRTPNAQSQGSLRANVNAAVSERGAVRVSSGYVRSTTRAITTSDASPYGMGQFNSTAENPYGGATGSASPDQIFAQTSSEQLDRFFGNASADWRPRPWLVARATVGLDLSGRNRSSLARPGDVPNGVNEGAVGDERARQVATTGDFGVTATARRGRVSFRTAAGAQYVRNLSSVLSSYGRGLPPGGSSVNDAANIQSKQGYVETVTLGSFLEEQIGLNDRLFFTAAVRADGASAFGQSYDAVLYPKVSASWLITDEPFMPRVPGLSELRLRYAYGSSGQQPTPSMSLPVFEVSKTVEGGASQSAVVIFDLGNTDLRPERVREHEFGADAQFFGARARIGATWYRRRTTDQIVSQLRAPGFGAAYTNLGLTTQHGFELEVAATVLDSRMLSWDLSLNRSSYATKLIDVGDARTSYDREGGYVEGYPLGARFMLPLIGYDDANGNGIIERIFGTELFMGDSAVFMGQSTPSRTLTLTSAFGFFDRRLRLSALIERRSGYTQLDQLKANQCNWSSSCREAVDPTAPLADQARLKANNAYDGTKYGTGFTYIKDGAYTRFSELSLSADVPAAFVRAFGGRTGTFTVSGRNLGLWSQFDNADPESAARGGFYVTGAAQIPQASTWSFRLDIGF